MNSINNKGGEIRKVPKITPKDSPIKPQEEINETVEEGGCVVNHNYVDAYSPTENTNIVDVPSQIHEKFGNNPLLECMIVGDILNNPKFKRRF